MYMTKTMRNSKSDELCFKTWWILYQARDVAFRIRTRELSQYGITTEQAATLLIIKMLNDLEKKVTPGEISKWILREPHSVSKILTRMEKDGFVTKTGGLGKKRNEVHITLTEKGEQAYRCSLKRESILDVMSVFSKAECLQLNSLLEKLRDRGLQTLMKKSEVFFP
jgi:MarR family transcriptional regulator, organic hydroperoxide resistance regulator